MRPFVRTVLGDIAPEELGVCYSHEHIVIAPSFTTVQNPEFRHDEVEPIVQELLEFHQSGGRAMVDSMPCDSGRDVRRLAEISRRSGVHIVCPTGLHLEKYYDPGHWGSFYSAAELVALFVAEIVEGVDAHDYNGPIVQRTPHRAGLIKVASGRDRLSAREQKVFSAAAEVHRRTGCPILTHTEQGTAALEQVTVLREQGATLDHVVLSHLDRNLNLEHHREVLRTGVRLEYDSAFRWEGPENPTLELVLQLAPEFPSQILLGMDAARRTYWKHFGGAPGLTFLLTTMREALLARGLSEELWHRIMVRNPAETYRFRLEPTVSPEESSGDR
jgi:phosphotriesterase-related protein